MNPDYNAAAPAAAEAPAPAAEAPAPAAEEAPPPPTGGQATTDYYGGSAAPSNPAWAAPAKMNPDYNAAAAPAAAEAPAAGACLESVASGAKALSLRFSADSAAIPQDAQAALSDLAKALKDCGGVVVEVAGYTDSVGSSGSNRILSELRAKKVVDFLTDAGVDASKLKAVGHGEGHPVADNTTAQGRSLNRRVELSVSGQ
jgi:outer membrane protein OmpA-like peptidoglycan-associated protein